MEQINYTTLIENLKTSEDKQRAEIINKLSKEYNKTIPLLWIKAVSEENPRAILSVIRDIIKKEKPRGIFIRTVGKSKEKLSDLLQHSDAKVRKNACGIIGEIGDAEYLEPLYSAYEAEEQLFVRSSYVLSIGNCGGEADAARLQKILEDLTAKEKASEDPNSLMKDEKHFNEEKLALTRAIAKLSPPVAHIFKGFENPVPMVLTAMNDQFQVTAQELKDKSIDAALVSDGILIKEKDINKVFGCRTFYELLLPLEHCKNLKFDYKEIAAAIIKSDAVKLLNQCHEGDGITPFWYRVEFKTINYSRERGEFVKNLSRELDEISKRKLRNSTSSYEIEIRVVEMKHRISVFIKLFTVKDNRFAYREQKVPASINPVTAAIVMKAIGKWLKPNAKVIDPFCGAGTMLIERAKSKEFGTLTGIDIFNSAIIAATQNSKLANVKMNLVNEDILEFSTYEVFDEMITNMPFSSRAGANDFDRNLYRNFINRIPQLIKPGGLAFLYTVERNLLQESLRGNSKLQLMDEIKFESGGLTPHLYIIKVNK